VHSIRTSTPPILPSGAKRQLTARTTGFGAVQGRLDAAEHDLDTRIGEHSVEQRRVLVIPVAGSSELLWAVSGPGSRRPQWTNYAQRQQQICVALEGRNGRFVLAADDEVAFPVTHPAAVVGDDRPVVDEQDWRDEARPTASPCIATFWCLWS
jgi:hypothetical protein